MSVPNKGYSRDAVCIKCSSISIVSVPNEGYSRDAVCTKLDIYVFIVFKSNKAENIIDIPEIDSVTTNTKHVKHCYSVIMNL